MILYFVLNFFSRILVIKRVYICKELLFSFFFRQSKMPKTRTYNKKAGANAAWHTAPGQYGRVGTVGHRLQFGPLQGCLGDPLKNGLYQSKSYL